MNTPSPVNTQQGKHIRIRGTVQGVGFRPFIAQLAEQFNLTGHVANDAEGVLIQVWGSAANLDKFIHKITDSPPPLAEIHSMNVTAQPAANTTNHFAIISSQSGRIATHVAADAVICEACLAELFEPDNRRYLYPFINCTHCGPRLSIIQAMPYDRAFTSMSAFQMCPSCQFEYHDPHNRRYHAQPNACPECGPQIWLEDQDGKSVENHSDSVFTDVAAWLAAGKIIAIKGIGGFHLACDARNNQAVDLLRKRKHRDAKPLAMMARDITQISRYVQLDALDIAQLQSVEAPIVLMQQKSNHDLADNIAPEQSRLGFMLPYSPLHHILMHHLDFPIVLTSGNLSEAPQYIDNAEAREKLYHLADGFLMHDRAIVNRLDDSVVSVIDQRPRVLRRGRGYAPSCLYLHQDFHSAPAILAMGAELKSTFCLLRNGQAIVSQHIGDLENQHVLNEYIHSLSLYRDLYDFEPDYIATDCHPNYLSSQYGETLADHFQCSQIKIPHHHAHIAAVMAENGLGLKDKVIGIALDGLGMGPNDELWGAEVILASYTDFHRLATIEAKALLGGSMAMREPWRNVYAHLHPYWDEFNSNYVSLPLIERLKQKPLRNIEQMLNQHINAPLASSMGRVFDAVAAALNICFDKQSFEGQAAMILEALASEAFAEQADHAYEVAIDWHAQTPEIVWCDLWRQILADLHAKQSHHVIAARFHHGLVNTLNTLLLHFENQYPDLPIVLCGGVFQNKLLHEGLANKLRDQHKKVLSAARFPTNDGALSLGQAVISAAQILTDGQPQRP